MEAFLLSALDVLQCKPLGAECQVENATESNLELIVTCWIGRDESGVPRVCDSAKEGIGVQRLCALQVSPPL